MNIQQIMMNEDTIYFFVCCGVKVSIRPSIRAISFIRKWEKLQMTGQMSDFENEIVCLLPFFL